MKIAVDPKLVKDIKTWYPETERMTATVVIDWALRILLVQKNPRYPDESMR